MARLRSILFIVLVSCSFWATAQADAPRVLLSTSHGEIVLELNPEKAPATVENFLQYVNDGFYSGTIFHRVIEGFMIQGGGFDASFERKRTRAQIRNEADNGLKNLRYSIAMARTNAPHSASSQFFINSVDNPNLDHTSPTPRGWGYAVFGSVVEGQDIVRMISELPTGPGGPFRSDAPRTSVVINEALLLDIQAEELLRENNLDGQAPTTPVKGESIDQADAGD